MARALILFLLVASCGAWAQNYPTRPITLVVPFAPGGSTDFVARALARSLVQTIGQPVIVENRAGASGAVGAAHVAKAAPDGYTLLLHSNISMSRVALEPPMSFRPLEDFGYIGQIAEQPMVVMAARKMVARDFQEFATYLKANSNKATFAQAGPTAILCGIILSNALGIGITSVPYKGGGPAMRDLIGNQVDFTCDALTTGMSSIQAGNVKAYAVTSITRSPFLPEVPTLHESGLIGFDVSIWLGLFSPAGTPGPVINRLVPALKEALRDASFVARLKESGLQPVPLEKATPEALQKWLKADIERWTSKTIGAPSGLETASATVAAGQSAQSEAEFAQTVAAYRAASSQPALTEDLRRLKIQAEFMIGEKKFFEAIQLYDEALKIAPWWADGRYNRALILGELKRYGEAIKEMNRYLQLEPNASNARAIQDQIYRWEAGAKIGRN